MPSQSMPFLLLTEQRCHHRPHKLLPYKMACPITSHLCRPKGVSGQHNIIIYYNKTLQGQSIHTEWNIWGLRTFQRFSICGLQTHVLVHWYTSLRSLIRSLAMCRSFTARNEMEIIMDVEIWFFGILVECLGYIMTAYQLCRLLRGLQCRPVNAELSNNQRSHCLLKYFRRKRQKSLRKSMRISNLRHLTIRWRSADEEKAEILRTECRNLAQDKLIGC